MTDDDIRAAYLVALIDVAPDLSADGIGPDDHLQDDLDLDSMDVLNLVAALHKALGVDIPEADYPQIATLALAVPYLARRLAA
ncbi:phosphopantetheine-binding protein [Rhodovulum euryhalinum]|uniref:Acyl carrier protein n=1 Tax=Rhodovulum euryhalinum TaxID=35805 RepID=A0A4R2KGT0_9RHOB|nr:phosphopantetheine-binding protein [Rhodovulum euryhalinum]TCO72344.1 acyl carrier protein [Rhodovulum euryhalinum]